MTRADATYPFPEPVTKQQIPSFVTPDIVSDIVSDAVSDIVSDAAPDALVDAPTARNGQRPAIHGLRRVDQALCPVEVAARIIGQKWTLQIVHTLIDGNAKRFCEIQEALNGVNPSTLTSRLKYLEEMGMVQRNEVSTIPPHVEYSLSEMGRQLESVIREITQWSRKWLCPFSE